MSGRCCEGECEICLSDEAGSLAVLVDDLERDRAATQAKRDREQARALFEAAGKPVPAWLREPT
jgi:hypothetical protein